MLDRLNEQDVQEVYEQVSAERPVRRLIAPDYLENLRVKFLDTRQEALPSGETSAEGLVSQQQPQSLSDLSMKDYEKLIYVNVSAYCVLY